MSTFTWVPDQGATKDTSTDVNTSKFGEGYSQRVPNGINSVSDVWNLNFSLRPRSQIEAIEAFLKTCKGSSNFTWLTPNNVTLKFICSKWSAVYNYDSDASLSCSFVQVFES